jgi:hypothetical protein
MKTPSTLARNTNRTISLNKTPNLTAAMVAEKIIESFKEQSQVYNHFKLRVKKMVNSMEYANPNEAKKLNAIIDSYAEQSRKLSEHYMTKLLTSNLISDFVDCQLHLLENVSDLNLPNEEFIHNDNWMKDWMEQADNYKDNPEAMALIENDLEGFLHYADQIEGKYV